MQKLLSQMLLEMLLLMHTAPNVETVMDSLNKILKHLVWIASDQSCKSSQKPLVVSGIFSGRSKNPLVVSGFLVENH